MDKIKVAKELVKLAKQLIAEQGQEKEAKKVTAGWTIYGFDDVRISIKDSLNEFKKELKTLTNDKGKKYFSYVGVESTKRGGDTSDKIVLDALVNDKIENNKYNDVKIIVDIATDGSNCSFNFLANYKGYHQDLTSKSMETYIGNDDAENSLQHGSGGHDIVQYFNIKLNEFKKWFATI